MKRCAPSSKRGKRVFLDFFIILIQRSFLTFTRENALKGGQRRIYLQNSILHRHAELSVSGKNSLRRPPQSHPPRQNWQSWWSWSWQTGWCLPYNEFLEETPPPSSAYLDRCAVSAQRQKLASYTGVCQGRISWIIAFLQVQLDSCLMIPFFFDCRSERHNLRTSHRANLFFSAIELSLFLKLNLRINSIISHAHFFVSHARFFISD